VGHAGLNLVEAIRIETGRFVLRQLTPSDASERYASWFSDPEVKRYITAASAVPSVDDLREYIAARAGRPDILFLGVHTRDTDTHIGNIKFEPVDRAAGLAMLGIMIGDPAWRGRGAASEVIVGANEWLAANRGIREVVLGVARDNAGAKRAYEKAGFVVTPRDDDDPRDWIRMVWRAAGAAA
jgi:ribosomal-protein-alanine N-acetyltransferase